MAAAEEPAFMYWGVKAGLFSTALLGEGKKWN
jgi:hypothetical protein